MFNWKSMRGLALLLFAGIAVLPVAAQTTPPVDPKVLFQIEIASTQQEFHIGERIPIKLSFSSTAKNRYQINMAQYDRSGRMSYEHFKVVPSDGAVDPLPTYIGGMGGLTNFRFLSSEPWSITLNLNEWVRFTRPGEYKVTVTSNRVGARDPANAFGTSAVGARSNEITFKVIDTDPVWQKRVFGEAVKIFDAPAPAKPEEMQQYTLSRRQALETLRFLGTVDATRELAKRMRGEDSDGLDYLCSLGLISSPERSAAYSALEDALKDPDRAINANFLYTRRMVSSDQNAPNPNWREAQQRVVEEMIAALPAKRGRALSISLSTAVNEVWNGNGNSLPQETTDKLVNQLVSMFDQLPLTEQNSLLSYRWDKIKGAEMLPVLRKYAETYRDFPQMRESRAFDSLALSASALRHWYELDPTGARPAIIKEITRPRPRFDARVLGMLPDETLPEVDFALAEHFAASHDLDGSSHLASLIARYATAAILPQITEKLDPKIGKWACTIQDPILAYLLRVSPETARPRIERAVKTRGEEFTACNEGLFQAISEIHYDPVLEDIGIRSLDDRDPSVAMTAATMLGMHGSAAAESALLRRFESWSAQWAGHEAELDLIHSDGLNEKHHQLGLGNNLMNALATGKSWLSDKVKLQKLSQLTQVKRIQQELNRYMKMWEEPTLTIAVEHNPQPYPFHARVAQYEFQSMSALKDKLAQFPSGTSFYLATPARDSTDNQSLAELRAFLSEHGMSVAGEKRLN
jgi:hypothetical protein